MDICTAGLLCCSYTKTDKELADIPRSKIIQQLIEVGFDEKRQADVVGGLSGGWKMKLELARAMLYNADLLLLDEVRHLKISACLTTDTFSYQPTNHVFNFHLLPRHRSLTRLIFS